MTRGHTTEPYVYILHDLLSPAMPLSLIPSPCPSHPVYCVSAANDGFCVSRSLGCVLGASQLLLALPRLDASGFFHGQTLSYFFIFYPIAQVSAQIPPSSGRPFLTNLVNAAPFPKSL